jgi:hypothetical protein
MNPVKMVCLKYDPGNFNTSLDIIGDIYSILFTLLKFR